MLYVSQAFDIFGTVCANMVLKALAAAGITITVFLFSQELYTPMMALGLLVTFDAITGMAASAKEGLPIQSRRFVKTPIKLGVYMSLVSVAHLAEVVSFGDILHLEMGMIAYLGLTEALSILENFGRLGYKTPYSIMSKLQVYVKSMEKKEETYK